MKDAREASPGEIWTSENALYLVVKGQTRRYREEGIGSPDIIVTYVAGPKNPVSWGRRPTSLNPGALERRLCTLSTFERHHGPLGLSDWVREQLEAKGVRS